MFSLRREIEALCETRAALTKVGTNRNPGAHPVTSGIIGEIGRTDDQRIFRIQIALILLHSTTIPIDEIVPVQGKSGSGDGICHGHEKGLEGNSAGVFQGDIQPPGPCIRTMSHAL